MSDLMLHGVLNMPYPDNPSELQLYEWLQFRDAARLASKLLPRWRPIKDLREEWKDGRVIVLRFADGDVSTFDGIDAREWRNYLRVNKPLIVAFLDFGGHAMPSYDGV